MHRPSLPAHSASRRRLLKAGLAAGALPLLPACGGTPADPKPGDAAWRNWSGGQQSQPRQWLNPRDEQELIAQMRAAPATMRVTGASHSFSALCKTNDTLFSLDQLSGVVRHDAEKQQATLWAGTRLHDAGEPLWQLGQSFSNQGDVDPQSLGGACGTSTHGTGATLGSFSSMVRGVRLVTPDGDVIEADAEHDADVFHAACTSLGALGVVTQLTLQNVPRYKLAEHEWMEDLEVVLGKLDSYVQNNRHFEFWCFFEAKEAIVKTLNPTTDADTPPPSFSLPVDHILDLTSKIADGIVGMDGPMQRFLTAMYSPVQRVGRAYKIFPSDRNSRFNEMEYELPAEQGPECLQEILATVRKSRVRTLFPLEYRYVAADDCWLSPMQGRATVAISVHQHHSVDYRPLFDLVEPIFWKYSGRPHWGKLHTLDARRLAPLYPHWDAYQAVRQRLDPKGRMLNEHLSKVLIA